MSHPRKWSGHGKTQVNGVSHNFWSQNPCQHQTTAMSLCSLERKCRPCPHSTFVHGTRAFVTHISKRLSFRAWKAVRTMKVTVTIWQVRSSKVNRFELPVNSFPQLIVGAHLGHIGISAAGHLNADESVYMLWGHLFFCRVHWSARTHESRVRCCIMHVTCRIGQGWGM